MQNDPAKLPVLPWDDFRIVLAIFRAGSFAGAARRLGLDETTVSRRLAAAERRLGLGLFDRADGVLRATEAGTTLSQTAETMERSATDGLADARGAARSVAGPVRLSTVPILVNRVLIPALPSLRRAYPDLVPILAAERDSASLLGRDADLALRLARPKREAAVVARKLCALKYGVYAHRDAALSSLGWLGQDDRRIPIPQADWVRKASAADGKSIVLIADDSDGLANATLSILGKALLPIRVGDAHPDLIRLESPIEPPSRELWLLLHPDVATHARIRAAADWLISLFPSDTA